MGKKDKNVPKKNVEKVVETEVMNGDAAVITPTEADTTNNEVEEAINEVTSPGNVENIEEELKEEYKEEVKQGEEALNEKPEANVDLGEIEEIADKYGNAQERLDKIVNETAPENLEEALQNELSEANDMKEKLEKKVSELESKMSSEQRSLINSRMTNLWNGVRYT